MQVSEACLFEGTHKERQDIQSGESRQNRVSAPHTAHGVKLVTRIFELSRSFVHVAIRRNVGNNVRTRSVDQSREVVRIDKRARLCDFQTTIDILDRIFS